MGIILDIIVLALAVAPVIWLMRYIYKKDKYEKEPLGMLVKAFIFGIFAIPMDIIVVGIINSIWTGQMVFYSAFWEAGIPEEFCKWSMFMLIIWRNRNFNEFFDGIVYACFISLGFACIENIMYVFGAGSFFGSIGIGLTRALLSVPGHFLFGVLMGYYLALAKFDPQNRSKYLIYSLIIPMLAHGVFDYILMLTSSLSEGIPFIGTILLVAFIYFDIKLWKVGVRKINEMQEATRNQHINRIFKNS
ncbi:MAG: PrsW family intramembrane metalloprotease [Bacteroidales bacterium]|nr:PrsW family intramembrane metalloprotease [Bacteroidales bacterium]